MAADLRSLLKEENMTVQAKCTKAADFRSLSKEEIMTEVAKAKRGLFTLRFKQASREVGGGAGGRWSQQATHAGA